MQPSTQLLALVSISSMLASARLQTTTSESMSTTTLMPRVPTTMNVHPSPSKSPPTKQITITSNPQIDHQAVPYPAPFHTGQCTVDLTQTDRSRGNFADFILHGPHWNLAMDIRDASNKTIGSAPPTNVEGNPLELLSWLPDPLIATPASTGGVITFHYGKNVTFSSEKTGGIPGCKVGQWERTGQSPHRSVKCVFNCDWPRGGVESRASNGVVYDPRPPPGLPRLPRPGSPILPKGS